MLEHLASFLIVSSSVLGIVFMALGFTKSEIGSLSSKIQNGHPRDLDLFISQLGQRPSLVSYWQRLSQALSIADNVFGKPLGMRSLFICLGIATFYPVVLLILGWVIDGSSPIGGVVLFPSGIDTSQRLLFLFVILINACSIYIIYKYTNFIEKNHSLFFVFFLWLLSCSYCYLL